MSTYLATGDLLEYSEINQSIPIAIHHGIYDPVVPEQLGQQAAESLTGQGYSVSYKNYPMEHAVCPKQIGDISEWLQTLLK